MMNPDTTESEKEELRLDWHSAFYAALQAELVDYLDVLQFEQEHPLNEQPLRIDVLVIKKQPGVIIDKNIAVRFRGHNIFEYKSPDDSFGVTEYLKTIGYAYLYQAVEAADYSDITVSIVCTMRPVSLFKYFRDSHQGRYAAKEKHHGIYVASGERFPVQIIESKKLPPEGNAWLASLKKDTDRTALEQAIISKPNVGKLVNLSAYWYVVSRANTEYLMEVIEMNLEEIDAKWEAFLEKIGYTKLIEARLEPIVEANYEEKLEAVVKGLQANVPLQQLSDETGFSLERIRKISGLFMKD